MKDNGDFMIIHVVQKGDTLYSLGKKYGVNYEKIASDNGMLLNETLVIGQALVIINNSNTPKIGSIEVNGYTFTSINHDLLESILPYLTYLSIFGYNILPDGNLRPINDDEIINISVKHNVAPVMVITNIGFNGKFDSDLIHLLLSSEDLQNTLITNILEILKGKKYKGLDIDFEYIYPEDKDLYNNFLNKIHSILNNTGYFLTTAVAPKTSNEQSGILYSAHDYSFHGKVADHVILMTYEWGYSYSEPMAIAPINGVERVINYAVTEIPSNKILMGIPNYGYDWEIPHVKGTRAQSIGNNEAVNLARINHVNIKYDEKSQAPYFDYREDNQEHQVWFEDARSINEKLMLVKRFDLAGVSYWTIDRYFPQNWLILSSLFDIKKY